MVGIKIDTSKWKSYVVGDLMDAANTGNILARDVEDGTGDTPFVTASGVNNGVAAYIDASKYEIIEGNCILIGGKTFTLTYQKDDFVSNDSHNIVIRFKNENTSKFHYLYLISILRATLGTKYFWGDAVTKEKLLADNILLPQASDGQPDWDYMEQYMRAMEQKAKKHVKDLLAPTEAKPLNITNFKKFHLYDDGLFIIDNGTKLDKVRMKTMNPSVNFVGRSNANNGVTDFIDRLDDIEPYPAGYMTLSLGGEYLGSCFVQKAPFYTSQNVAVLIPQQEMSWHAKQYIATMVFREGRLHYKAFVDELNRHVKRDFTIPLPITKEGELDWAYMEQYMQGIEAEASKRLASLSIV